MKTCTWMSPTVNTTKIQCNGINLIQLLVHLVTVGIWEYVLCLGMKRAEAGSFLLIILGCTTPSFRTLSPSEFPGGTAAGFVFPCVVGSARAGLCTADFGALETGCLRCTTVVTCTGTLLPLSKVIEALDDLSVERWTLGLGGSIRAPSIFF